MTAQLKSDPLRVLALLFIATSGIFALAGTLIGTALLDDLSGVPVASIPPSIQLHAYLQIYGFIYGFVFGVAYILLPRFKGTPPPSVGVGYLNYALLTAANIGLSATGIMASQTLFAASSILLFLATLVFAVQAVKLTLSKRWQFPEADPFIIIAAASACLSSLTLVASASYPQTADIFSPASVELPLLGFAGSMIYAVGIRSTSFRLCDYRARLAKLTAILQASAAPASFAATLSANHTLQLLGATLFLLAAASAAATLRVFEHAHPLMYRPTMTKIHYKIVRYNDLAMVSAYLWLLLGTALSVVDLAAKTPLFVFRDLSVHSAAVGFIGSSIVCFAPMVLPGALGRKAPTTGLSYYPLFTLDAGLAVRAVGDTVSPLGPPLPPWEALSGPLILVSMFWFLYMVHSVGRKREAPEKEEFNVIDEKTSVRVADIRVDGRPFWFVYRGGEYFVVLKDSSPSLGQGSVRLEVLGKRCYATVSKVEDKKEAKKLVKLFKDKYGEKIFTYTFGKNVDTILRITTRDADPS